MLDGTRMRLRADHGRCERLLAYLAKRYGILRQEAIRQKMTCRPALRMSVSQAMEDYGRVDIARHTDAVPCLRRPMKGYRFGPSDDYSMRRFFSRFFWKPWSPPRSSETDSLYDYPGNGRRWRLNRESLWANGLNSTRPDGIGDAFSELIDRLNRGKRFEEEQQARSARGAPVYPIDEELLRRWEGCILPRASP